MPDLTRDHPAVEAAFQAYRDRMAADGAQVNRLPERMEAICLAITAALPHLTADDLRHTPVGRALMAEGWEVGAATAWARTAEGFNAECAFEHCAPTGDDPYVEFREANPDMPNPYREDQP